LDFTLDSLTNNACTHPPAEIFVFFPETPLLIFIEPPAATTAPSKTELVIMILPAA